MKQINATVASDELSRLVSSFDTEDKLLSSAALIAESYKFIVLQMTEDVIERADNIPKWTDLLSLVADYHDIIEILHRESKLSPHC